MNYFRNHFSCMFTGHPWSMAIQFRIPGACAVFCRSAFAALCQSQLRGTERIIPKACSLMWELYDWVGMRTYSQMQMGSC